MFTWQLYHGDCNYKFYRTGTAPPPSTNSYQFRVSSATPGYPRTDPACYCYRGHARVHTVAATAAQTRFIWMVCEATCPRGLLGGGLWVGLAGYLCPQPTGVNNAVWHVVLATWHRPTEDQPPRRIRCQHAAAAGPLVEHHPQFRIKAPFYDRGCWGPEICWRPLGFGVRSWF